MFYPEDFANFALEKSFVPKAAPVSIVLESGNLKHRKSQLLLSHA